MASKIDIVKLPDGRSISYNLSHGAKPGPVVVLSNSLGEDFTSWDRVVPVLTNAGFSVLRYDQPGHGQSGVPADLSATRFEMMADDVADLLRSLGIEAVHAWVGVSMGGCKGVYFAARHPGILNKLVVCGAIFASPANEGLPDLFEQRVQQARDAGSMAATLQGTRERWFGKEWMDAHPEETARMVRAMETTTVDGYDACCAALRTKSFDLAPHYANAGEGCTEALMVVGEKDADLPTKMRLIQQGLSEGLKAAGKDSAVGFKIVKNAGHVPYIDGHDEFCQIILDFIQ